MVAEAMFTFAKLSTGAAKDIALVKKANKTRTCWHRRPFRLIFLYQIFKNEIERKEWTEPIGILACINA